MEQNLIQNNIFLLEAILVKKLGLRVGDELIHQILNTVENI